MRGTCDGMKMQEIMKTWGNQSLKCEMNEWMNAAERPKNSLKELQWVKFSATHPPQEGRNTREINKKIKGGEGEAHSLSASPLIEAWVCDETTHPLLFSVGMRNVGYRKWHTSPLSLFIGEKETPMYVKKTAHSLKIENAKKIHGKRFKTLDQRIGPKKFRKI